MILRSLVVTVLLCAPACAVAQAPSPPKTAQGPSVPPPAHPDIPPTAFVRHGVAPLATAVQLFAAVEEAWAVSDGERLASLVDTTRVQIALKPDTPPASAATRSAAAFLFADQMRLVRTLEFHVTRIEVPDKGPARATAQWTGDWGGRQGVRRIRVQLRGAPTPAGWLLTGVLASD